MKSIKKEYIVGAIIAVLVVAACVIAFSGSGNKSEDDGISSPDFITDMGFDISKIKAGYVCYSDGTIVDVTEDDCKTLMENIASAYADNPLLTLPNEYEIGIKGAWEEDNPFMAEASVAICFSEAQTAKIYAEDVETEGITAIIYVAEKHQFYFTQDESAMEDCSGTYLASQFAKVVDEKSFEDIDEMILNYR